MDLKELCSRGSNNYSIEEMKYVVREYIYERKKNDVVIDLNKAYNIADAMNPFFLQGQEAKLYEASTIAKKWFNENKFK